MIRSYKFQRKSCRYSQKQDITTFGLNHITLSVVQDTTDNLNKKQLTNNNQHSNHSFHGFLRFVLRKTSLEMIFIHFQEASFPPIFSLFSHTCGRNGPGPCRRSQGKETEYTYRFGYDGDPHVPISEVQEIFPRELWEDEKVVGNVFLIF